MPGASPVEPERIPWICPQGGNAGASGPCGCDSFGSVSFLKIEDAADLPPEHSELCPS